MTESSQMDTVETLFFSAKLKIEWANIHIGYLNTLLRNISADETYRMGIEHDPKTGKYRLKVEGAQNTLLSGSGVVRRITLPGRRRARRGGPCPGTGRCARTRRKRGRAAASPARRRGAVAARSAAATRPPPWC